METVYPPKEATLKFYLPEHEHEFKYAVNGVDYLICLSDIHNACRRIWKYKEDATEEEIKLAEEIGQMAGEWIDDLH